ncbi:hypothetical protein WICMUC_000603 [Wickerhamomyces mucosus]|uniref:C2H2-type domain-containing protein n=1 Tax=Wickerhamomyces mucosus TaxID=1378264 RepID=A0A9P8PYG2_9ASCO|nr:hypothetical protein WICMUC_000603 [Wickerhamomyces mucosus]
MDVKDITNTDDEIGFTQSQPLDDIDLSQIHSEVEARQEEDEENLEDFEGEGEDDEEKDEEQGEDNDEEQEEEDEAEIGAEEDDGDDEDDEDDEGEDVDEVEVDEDEAEEDGYENDDEEVQEEAEEEEKLLDINDGDEDGDVTVRNVSSPSNHETKIANEDDDNSENSDTELSQPLKKKQKKSKVDGDGDDDDDDNDDGAVTEISSKIDLDEPSDSRSCEWGACGKTYKNIRLLFKHIIEEHINNTLIFYWGSYISPSFNDKRELINHIATYLDYTLYIDPHLDSLKSFRTIEELNLYLEEEYNNSIDEDSKTLIKWFHYLRSSDNSNKEQMSDDFLKLSKVKNDKQFVKILPRAAIDFQKMLNVGITDLVTEPIKKKGRTATAEINANIREPYYEDDKDYKKALADYSRSSFDSNRRSHTTPSNHEIDVMKEISQLEDLTESLQRKESWSLEVQQILIKDLTRLQKIENELWLKKESLLQTNMELEIPDTIKNYVL